MAPATPATIGWPPFPRGKPATWTEAVKITAGATKTVFESLLHGTRKRIA